MDANPVTASGRADLQAWLGHRFRDGELLAQALRHRSYANEHDVDPLQCNERLEFLGDAIVGAVAARMVYERHPERDEGWLTEARSRLVRNETLGRIAGEAGIGEMLELGAGVRRQGGHRQRVVLARALEAVIGAVWVDGGDEAARACVARLLGAELDGLGDVTAERDAKSLLQQLAQAESGETPRYSITGERGPAHEPEYTAEVAVGGETLACGTGGSKRAAEQAAAARALARLDRLDQLDAGGAGARG